jgi:hypothetical protein
MMRSCCPDKWTASQHHEHGKSDSEDATEEAGHVGTRGSTSVDRGDALWVAAGRCGCVRRGGRGGGNSSARGRGMDDYAG